jgi:cytosine permease
MFFIMLGFTFFSASMSVGAKLGNGLDLGGFIWSTVIGGIILGAYTGILAYVGSSTGLTLDLLARRSFGKYGSYLPSALISFTQT